MKRADQIPSGVTSARQHLRKMPEEDRSENFDIREGEIGKRMDDDIHTCVKGVRLW